MQSQTIIAGLMNACQLGVPQEPSIVAGLLIRAQQQHILPQNIRGPTEHLIHCLVNRNDGANIMTLVLKMGLSPNFPDANGNAPLHVAAEINNSTMITFLLNNTRASPNRPNSASFTPFMLAIYRNHDAAFNAFMDDVNKLDVNLRDSVGNTALLSATALNHPAMVRRLLRDPRVLPFVTNAALQNVFEIAVIQAREMIPDILQVWGTIPDSRLRTIAVLKGVAMAIKLDHDTNSLLKQLASAKFPNHIQREAIRMIANNQTAIDLTPEERASLSSSGNGTPLKVFEMEYIQKRTDIERKLESLDDLLPLLDAELEETRKDSPEHWNIRDMRKITRREIKTLEEQFVNLERNYQERMLQLQQEGQSRVRTSSINLLFKPETETTTFNPTIVMQATGLLYLLKTFKNTIGVLNESPELRPGQTQRYSDVASMMIFWQCGVPGCTLFTPPDLVANLRRALQKKAVRFILIPLSLQRVDLPFGHQNFLLIDKEQHTIEHFDPTATETDPQFHLALLENELRKLFVKIMIHFEREGIVPVGGSYRYLPATYLCPVANVQTRQYFEQMQLPSDPAGFCVAWTYWYVELRLANPDKPAKELLSRALLELGQRVGPSGTVTSLTAFIRNYAQYLEELRQQYFPTLPSVIDISARQANEILVAEFKKIWQRRMISR